ncbi:hypothetical protein FIBSPDRAFT_958643 [Athelia psychrophila]|uniref:UTP25 NTP hydrolase-like domain-containing protein n=1 Tax=Athelia psychrophila TaxID=1759441 RepID=A0A166ECS6_9AGAM|nr:hypothetical protein FIBSPDRAFT_958643 [Fibularhizoctonia sp. CBS 109695]
MPAPRFQLENHVCFRVYWLLVGAADKLAKAQGSHRVWLENYMETLRENCDDGFWVGAKTSAKQFLEFYGSDVVIASPLGWQFRRKKYRLLSAIEVLVIR